MMRTATIVICILAIFLINLPPEWRDSDASSQQNWQDIPFEQSPLIVITANGEVPLIVELAERPEQKRLGLMHRTYLPDNAGMLFDFGPESKEVSMWMRNTLIPLDMLFIRPDGTIAHIVENTAPKSEVEISSVHPVTAVLELSGGAVQKYGISVNDRVAHAWFDTGAPAISEERGPPVAVPVE